MFPAPGSPAPPQWYCPPRTPPRQQLPITYVYLLPAIPYYLYTTYYLLLHTTTYYQLLTTTYPTPPHPTGGEGDWTMLLLLGYHDHGWGGGTQNVEHIFRACGGRIRPKVEGRSRRQGRGEYGQTLFVQPKTKGFQSGNFRASFFYLIFNFGGNRGRMLQCHTHIQWIREPAGWQVCKTISGSIQDFQIHSKTCWIRVITSINDLLDATSGGKAGIYWSPFHCVWNGTHRLYRDDVADATLY